MINILNLYFTENKSNEDHARNSVINFNFFERIFQVVKLSTFTRHIIYYIYFLITKSRLMFLL